MRLLAAVAALLALLLAPAAARAAHVQESLFQDDSLLVYGTPDEQSNALDTMKALGADRVRVTVYWKLVAPDAGAATKPKFDATEPTAYPNGAWDRYDTLMRLAAAKGIGIDFNVSAPAPAWGVSNAPDPSVADVANPDPAEFGKFVQAVGARYSGSFTPAGAPGPLPRVAYWSIWNEPNQGGWLAPQWQSGQPFSAQLYRALVDAAWTGLGASGHQSDVVLVGETAPKGSNVQDATSPMKPLIFLRALYCVDKQLRPLQGAAAGAVGCPASNGGADFVSAHPGLFAATGIAHHPYNYPLPPDLKSRDPDFLSLADTPRLVHFVNGVFAAYGQARQGGVPIFFTEYGYQTKPPDPLGISWSKQAAYLDESEYMAWNFPAVQSTSQFLLVDDKPNSAFAPGSPQYWSTSQTGLLELDGSRKASFYSYPLPIWLPETRVRARRPLRVWAMRRNGVNGDPQVAAVQFARRHSRHFKTLKTATTTDPHGYLQTRVAVPRSGSVRVAWHNAGGPPSATRAVAVTAR
jgi:hypothetical protein